MAQTTSARRLKHWGWGYEDQQPSEQELREAAAAVRAHLGFDPEGPELQHPLEELEPRVDERRADERRAGRILRRSGGYVQDRRLRDLRSRGFSEADFSVR